jgi:hypothetical protein
MDARLTPEQRACAPRPSGWSATSAPARSTTWPTPAGSRGWRRTLAVNGEAVDTRGFGQALTLSETGCSPHGSA